jgi:hypothetical protein
MHNPASLFGPASDMETNESFMVSQAIACIDSFTDAFNARNLAGMDACLHFPHIILSGERLVIWEVGCQLPASFFDDLERDTGWNRTVYLDRHAVLVSPRKVHLFVEYSRNRADGSVITLHKNLWVVTYDGDRWGIKQRSY